MPIIYIKGSFYETPLHGHVRSDKQDGDKGRGMRRRWSPRAWGGGVRRVGYSWSTITCNLAVATRHHRISTIPRIQIAVSQFPFFSSEIHQGLYVSHIVISPTYNLLMERLSMKEPPPPPPFSLHTPPSPVFYTFALSWWTRIFVFSCPPFHPS